MMITSNGFWIRRLIVSPSDFGTLRPTRLQIVPIHPGDDLELDFFRTNRFTLADICTASEEFLLHLSHHLQGALRPLWLTLRKQSEMADLRTREQCRRCIRTGRYARAASDACCRVHGEIGIPFGDQNVVAVLSTAGRSRNIAAAGDNAIKRTSVDNQVFDGGKR